VTKQLAAIVGLGETPVGSVPYMTTQEMFLTSILDAIEDSGLSIDDVDGLYTAGTRADPFLTGSAALAEALDLRPKFCLTMPIGGMQPISAIYQAAAMIEAGVASVIVLSSCDNPLTGWKRGGTIERFAEHAAHPEFEAPYGAAVFSLYAQIAQRHMYEFGTTEEQMSRVSVQLRENALRHPKAQTTTRITIDEVMSSPMISSPFRRLHCSQISDGGGAIVLTSADRAKDCRKKPVYLIGAGESRDHLYVSQARDLTKSSARLSSKIAYEQADIGPQDLDFACLYDAYAMMPIIGLESIGACPRGEGGPFVEDGNIAPGGTLPINPHGGLLSYAHPGRSGGWLNMIEAIRQLGGEAGERQLPAELGLVQANAGVGSGEVTLILSV
jgi:acetyl-CoA acetyltransferase